MLISSWLSALKSSIQRRSQSTTRRNKKNFAQRAVAAESLEARTLLAAVGWDGDAGTPNWNDATNWSADVLPEAGDDVTIGAAFAGSTIVSTANVSVNSIISDAALRLNSGTVSVATLTHAHGGLIMAGGTLSGSTLNTGINTVIATTSGGTLDGVTVDANVDLGNVNNASLTVKDSLLNGTVSIGTAGTGNVLGRLYVGNTTTTSQTLAGSGTIVFGNSTTHPSYRNYLYNNSGNNSNPGTMTIASTMTIEGGNGIINNRYNNGTILNQGTINAHVANPYGLTVGTTGQWSSDAMGLLSTTVGTMNLAGTFTQPERFSRVGAAGGTVNVLGNLTGGLALDADTGSWHMKGGTLSGGSLTSATGEQFIATTSNGTLDGVTVESDLNISDVNNASLTVKDSLLNGTVSIGTSGTGNVLGRLYVGNTTTTSQTLEGTGTIVFGNSTTHPSYRNYLYNNSGNNSNPGTMTIASTMTIEGGNGIINNRYNNGTMLNQGTINAHVANPYGLTVGGTGSIANSGVLSADGGSLIVASSLALNDSGILLGTPTSTITISRSLSGTTQNNTEFSPQGTVLLSGVGSSSASPANFEAMSEDRGPLTTGLIDNFAYDTLSISNNAFVRLVDDFDNSDGTPEAVYVNQLIVGNGARLELNTLHLYAGSVQINGTGSIVGGTVQQVVSNATPTLAADAAAIVADEGGTATNTGVFGDANGNSTVTFGASIGTVTKNDANGTWSWSLDVADGPASGSVTITATDDQNAAAIATFNYAIDNVPPTISLSGNATVEEGAEYTLNLGVVTDPGQDTISSYIINWGDGTNSGILSGSPAGTTATHTFADGPATQNNQVTVTDEDGNFLAGSLNVVVTNVNPTASLVNNGPFNLGDTVTVSLLDQFDPSGADTSAGFRYAYSESGDFSGITYSSGSITDNSHDYIGLGAGSHTLYARIIDQDDGYTQYVQSVTITDINYAPEGTDGTLEILEDGVLIFASADFGFTDPDNISANALQAVKITTLPTSGSLTLNGTAVTAGQSIDAADIQSGLLKYAPVSNQSGNGYASFTFQVQDDGGTVSTGVDLDASPNTITIDVLPESVYNFSTSVLTVDEGNSTSTSNVVTVTRSGRTNVASSVEVVLSSGAVYGATAGSDFTAGPVTVNFGVGDTIAFAPIELLGDTELESDETVTLSLINPSGNGNVGTTLSSSTLTIINDDTTVVTNTDDSGLGSLRQAIIVANATSGPNTITFDIAGVGPHTIQPLSALPNITKTVTIDGYTENGASPNTLTAGTNASLQIIIDGTSAGALADGLTFSGDGADGSSVSGLVINRFDRHGLVILGTDFVSVTGNYIGTSVSGQIGLGNGRNGIAVVSGSTNNVIGTDGDGVGDSGERNVISGNNVDGISLDGVGTDFNVVSGNLIGTNVSGTAALGNLNSGVIILNGASNNLVGTDADGTSDALERNIISGNFGDGIQIAGTGTTDNSVLGNYIGTNSTATEAVGNQTGVKITSGAVRTLVGGSSNAARNIISGNAAYGVSVFSAGAGTEIQGNLIGTDVSAMGAIPNSTTTPGAAGILVSSQGANVVFIGTDSDGSNDDSEGNLISGNAANGILIQGGNSDTGSHVVAGNLIGTDISGVAPLGNAGVGIVILTSSDNRIGTDGNGAADEFEGNIIAANGESGILITDFVIGDSLAADGNLIAGNFIGVDPDGANAMGNQFSGIQLDRVANTVIGGLAPGMGNTIAYSGNHGILINGTGEGGATAEETTHAFRNSIFGNANLGIDIGGGNVTLNDPGDLVQDFPIIESAVTDNGNLILTGFVGAGRAVEFYLARPEQGQTFGEGETYLVTLTEGTAADTDAFTGSYGPDVNGVTVAAGAITQSRFEFTIPLPTGVSDGSLLSALALGPVSEFSPTVVVGEQTSALAPEIAISSSGITLFAGEELNVTGSFFDSDSTSWSGTVNYGDGSGTQPLALNPDNTFALNHTYINNGSFVVTVSVTDNSIATGTETLDVTIQNEAPDTKFNNFSITSPANEGQLVTLTGEFADAGAGDVHTVDIDWGDGNVNLNVPVDPGDRTFIATHTYLDDSNGDTPAENTPSATDVYRVQVTVSDQTGSSDSTPLGLFLEEVTNVLPSNLVVNFDNTVITEGQSVTLDGSFLDPGVLDTHTVRIDWGDGSPIDTIDLAANVFTFAGLPEFTHTYIDDPAAGADEYIVRVEVADDDEPNKAEILEQTIVVANQLPNALTLNLTPSINENETATLSGSFIDTGVNDSHRVFINWGDGKSQVLDLNPGVVSFAGISHVYANNPTTGMSYPVTVSVADNDDPATLTTSVANVTVNNVAPTLDAVTISGTVFTEGDTITISGNFDDVSLEDRHTVSVNWGDGATSPASVNSTFRTFTATHTFEDNGAGPLFNTDIVVTVTDNDGDSASTTRTVTVENADTIAQITPLESNIDPSIIPLFADLTDLGVADNHTFAWSARVSGSTGAPQTATTQQFDLNRSAAPNAIWEVSLTVTDDDGGVDLVQTALLAGTAGPDAMTLDDTTFNGVPATFSVTALGMAGEDIIDASAVTLRDVVLDGGADTDRLFGGKGHDRFFLRKGNDTAGIGRDSSLFPPTANAVGIPIAASVNHSGNDRFFLTPNSNLSVFDDSGENALDFTLADFGDSTGITFDLSVANGISIVQQDVAPAAHAGQHFVTAQGSFSELVGSTFGDELTAASGSTVKAGVGEDKLFVGSNTTNATLSGGADDDILEISGTGIDGLNFGGDDGIDTLLNMGSVIDLTFGGGADDDILLNEGSVTGDLIFGGDDGIDVLTNTGSIADLIFNGGADDDIFLNNGATDTTLDFSGDDDILLSGVGSVGSLTFGGDDGSDIFVNLGNVADLIFNGGADDDLFINSGAETTLNFGGDDDVLMTGEGVIGNLTFGGDDGVDVFANTGIVTLLTFNGGADDDIFINNGATQTDLSFNGDDDILLSGGGQIGGLTFGGDDGADIFANLGMITDLTFHGGADDDIFVNSGPGGATLNFGGDDDVLLTGNGTIGDLTFGGDDGVDLFANTGTVTNLIFNGGADDDIFINNGATQTDLRFNGDDDVLLSGPGTIGDLTFGGDDGADILANLGTVTDLTFNGGADDDIFVNSGPDTTVLNFGGDDDVLLSGSGDIVNLNFGGDDGVDTLINAGQVNGLIFGGGADDDILVNNGTILGDLVFGGDDDILLNTTTSNYELDFNGDSGADTLINEGSVLGELVFGGGADDDILVNTGSVLDLTFNGGADDDVLENDGTVLDHLNFGGDDGTDILKNTGTADTLVFGGGADDDIFINEGTVLGDLVFGGDDDVLIVGGTGSLTIGGGADDGADILLNTGTVAGDLTFGGGADDDILQNDGTVVGGLVFGGDSGDDILINTGDVTTLEFMGGADDDSLINSGSEIDDLIFGGDTGDDILINTGTDIINLTFNGGADDDILQNLGGGISDLVFGGDTGDDIFLNTGNEIGNLTFGGGADDDIFVNEGEGIGVLTFGGDIDPFGVLIPGTNSGDDTFIIRGSGNGLATAIVNFSGDGGQDAFQNNATGFASLTFHGGADDDVFQNNASGISRLFFGGDDGIDVFENNGNGVVELTFDGGADDDIFVNDGLGVSDLVFNGGADDDILINNGDGSGTLAFGGDDGVDTFINAGAGVTDLIFNGGADDDVFINTGSNLSDLVFGGDGGADTLINRSTAIGSFGLTFHGGADDDIFINDAAEVSNLNFGGDDGADGFQNNGFAVTGLTFNGGADDDIFINTGSQVDQLIFNGGADDDILQVGGTGLGTLTFGGDDGLDTLFSTAEVASLTFNGGADDDILQVSAGSVGTLSFDGDDGVDTLVNGGIVVDLTFTGGADDDILQNNGPSVGNLTFEGGADDDVLINNGPFVGTLNFGGDDGADTLINNGPSVDTLIFGGDDGPDSLRVQAGAITTLTFTGGADADSFNYNGDAGTQITFDGGTGNDLATWRGTADDFTFDGGVGDDLVFVIGSGTMSLDGNTGNDTVKFIGDPNADVTINDLFGGATDNSQDTLDFSSFTGGPLNLDLRLTTPQVQSANLTITIADGLGIENTLGTPFADVIRGNARNNILAGADFAEGFTGPVAATRASAQWVLLDFETHTNTDLRDDGTPERGEYVYSAAERDEIAANVEGVYRGPDVGAPWFDVQVTQDVSEIPAGTDHVTIFFNQTPDFGRPGGLASEIDLGNQNPGGSAQVQVNGLLGGVITAEDLDAESVTGGDGHGHGHGASDYLSFKADHGAISDAEIGSLKPAASSENFVALSSKVAAHELGHLLGLRHADSFGPIGFGLHDPPGGGSYKPVYTGPTGGFETFDHILGSPASVGSTRFDDLNDLFFGEREAVKLTYSFSDPADVHTTESTILHASQATAQPLELTTVAVPNTLSRGLNESKDFFVQMQGVNGTIAVDPATGQSENDWYSFTGTAGELINIDVMSNSLARFGTGPDDFVDTILRVYNSAGALVPYYGGVAVNDDIFEPTDSSIIDLVLPADDTYYVEVDAFSRDASDSIFDVTHPDSPLHPGNPNNILGSEFHGLRSRFEDTRDDTDIGNYQLFLFRYRDANSSDDMDDIKGNGGVDDIDGGPGDSYELVFDAGANFDGVGGNPAAVLEGSGFTRTVTLTDRGASSWTNSTVDYGDGNEAEPLAVTDNGDGTANFTLNSSYAQDGSYTVTITIRNDIGQLLEDSLTVAVTNVAPTVAADNAVVSVNEGTTAENTGTFADVGVEDVVSITADFGTVTHNSVAETWEWSFDGVNDLTRTVTITATDDNNGVSTSSFSLAVNNVTADFDAGADETLPTGSGVFVRNGITFTDPGSLDQHELTVDFGDGSTPQTVTLAQGVRSFDLSKIYTTSGTFTVSVTLDDGTDLSIDTFDVTVNLEVFYDFAATNFSSPEGDATNTTNVVTVTRSGATSIASTVDVVLAGSLTGTIALTFAPNEVTKVVPVELLGDSVVENDDLVSLSFANFSIGGLNGSTNATATLTIENDDAAPVTTNAGPYTINEGDPLTLDATGSTDADDGFAGLTFRWDVDGDGDFDENVTGATPLLTTADMIALGLADETTKTVTVEASDGTNVSLATAQLTINNVAPTLDNRTFSLTENALNGESVGIVTGTDPGTDTLTYSITGGTGDTAFAVDPATGEITVADEIAMDFETSPSFTLEVQVSDGDGGVETAIVTINLLNQASITGVVFVDTDQDGQFDANEPGLDGVTVELLDTAGDVLFSTVTSDGGLYFFEDLDASTYQIREVQPDGIADGAEQVGSLGGTVVANDVMELNLTDANASDYNFAEVGSGLNDGDTASIGFWQNKHGRALIRSGGSDLAIWLTSNFGNIFGNTFDGADGNDVARFYKRELFKQKGKKKAKGPAKVDAQFMAVALATYFTSSNLAGNTASSYGFNVSSYGIGVNVVNVGGSGAAFGVADNTDLTIMQILLATNGMTDAPDCISGFAYIYDLNGDGVIDDNERELRRQAKSLFSWINKH